MSEFARRALEAIEVRPDFVPTEDSGYSDAAYQALKGAMVSASHNTNAWKFVDMTIDALFEVLPNMFQVTAAQMKVAASQAIGKQHFG